ncbi:coproporphyrinogen III oxidase [Paucibacter sp. O1-1]|nr:coproporphyrinogen III oxidase [Paucibacter sp. O1-1]MDA3830023.1 coproporphyrinogen III oxidase [Paucibacter sp. O1-1]
MYRRGRYVEFNLSHRHLIWFTNRWPHRINPYVVMPPLVRWEYAFTPEEGSAEAELYEVYLKPQDWLAQV